MTGGAGFIGARLVQALRRRGVPDDSIVVPRSRTCDLRVAERCREIVQGCDVVFHLAAPTGGISFSRSHPASQYRDCALINLHMFDAAREAGIRKFVTLGNLLAYPIAARSPLREETLYDGPVADTHLGIGLAKRDLVSLAEMYHREFGCRWSASCRPTRTGRETTSTHAPARHPGDHRQVLPRRGSWSGATARPLGISCRQTTSLKVCCWPPNVWIHRRRQPGIRDRDLDRRSGRTDREAVRVHRSDHVRSFKGRRRSASRRVDRTFDALLGFSPQVSIEEGLRRTIEWYRQQTVAQ